jgi:Family of unknown function (DUF6873)
MPKIKRINGFGKFQLNLSFDFMVIQTEQMIIIADLRIPEQVKLKLKQFGQLLFLESFNVTYPAISGHPDIFLFKTYSQLIVAPNTPKEFLEQLIFRNIPFKKGTLCVGKEYPETAHYNVVETDSFLIHHKKYTDKSIQKQIQVKELIHVRQAYTRCNMIALRDDRFITSDKGIEKVLKRKGLETLYVDPKGIFLPGFDHGFIGGTCGVLKNRIFFIGSLDQFHEGEKIRAFLKDYEIIELYDGPLFDGGSLIFV